MHRQKLIHDIRISYEKFQIGKQVLVFLPVNQIETSSKLTQFWKGPFKIVDKMSDLVYKVNSGRNGSDQVIHCDRIRACKKQLLVGENEFDDNEMNEESLDEANYEDNRSCEDSREQEVVNDGKRIRRKPVWAKDYVFSCRSNVVKTKTTERKPPMQICPLCKGLIPRSETSENHVLRCSKERVTCGKYGKTFKKRAYLDKHEHTQHASKDSEPVCTINMPDDGEELDWEEDPDISVKADCEVSADEEDQKDTTATEEKGCLR